MGTNVYFYKKLEEETKNKIIAEIQKANNFDEIRDYISDLEYEHPENKEIHVGKRSAGWKFLFAREILKFCEPTKESICNWLSTGVVQNEYGEIITPEEFWEDYVESFQKGINLEEYYKEYPEEKLFYPASFHEEMINGFRFTKIECDFS